MLDFSHTPERTGAADVQVFFGNSSVAGLEWQTWVKPRGKTMLHIALRGKGANGGSGVIGAASAAAGGGGGGGGGSVSMIIPLVCIPDRLFLSLAGISTQTTMASYISLAPSKAAVNHILAIANGGANGGNASGATAGTAGAGGTNAGASTMPYGWSYLNNVLTGAPSSAGGTTGAGVALALPTTAQRSFGGTGGAGLGAGGAVGTAGGAYTVAGLFLEHPHPGGIGGAAATTPPGNGSCGRILSQFGIDFGYGGTGGGSTHGSATGAGLVQASGGDGAYGCGGGGSGGALTGSVAGAVGKGGPALAILTCW